MTGIKRRRKADNLVALRLRIEPKIARMLIKLAEQQKLSVSRCTVNLISKALEIE